MPHGRVENPRDTLPLYSSFGQLSEVRGGGVRGLTATYGENSDVNARAVSAIDGPRRPTGVTRMNAVSPMAGFGAASQARNEQLCCPGIPIASQLLLSFWKLRPRLWWTGQYVELQHASRSPADRVPARAETLGSSSARRAAVPASLRTNFCNSDRPPPEAYSGR
jgi:hypothetical protein